LCSFFRTNLVYKTILACAWRSLTTVLLGLVPRHLRRMGWKLRLRFLYALIFYVLLAVTTVGGLALAPIAAVTGVPWINVNYLEFLLRWWSISFWVLALAVLLRRRGLLRPRGAPIFSWENNLYCLTRWPLIAWGVTAALLHRIRPRQITFKVTPKSVDGLEPLPLKLMAPYLVTSAALAGASLYAEARTQAAGYVFLCLLGSVTYAVVVFLVPLLHAGETARANGVRFRTAVRRTAGSPLLAAVVLAIPVAIAVGRYPAYAIEVFGW